MDLEKYKDKEILMITPNAQKLNILDSFTKDSSLYNIKFMTIEEFKENYFYYYDEKTIDYLMNKYSLHIDIAKIYLENLYFIDLNKDYHHSKLQTLKNVKKDLIENNLIKVNKIFKNYLQNKTIIVENYYDLELYLINTLKEYNATFVTNDKKDINFKVKHFLTLEDEVVYTAVEIIKLINEGIDINKIFISTDDDYEYLLKRIFLYFNIPINIKSKDSIYGTKIVQDYLKTSKLDLESNNEITKKLIDVINSIVEIKDSTNYKTVLKDKLKNTYITPKTYTNAVNIVDIEKRSFKEDEYVFVLGFNQDHLPHFYKDESFIKDNMKDEVELFKTQEKNKNKKHSILSILTNIKNLSISYKDKSSFSEYYKSSLIEEENIEVEDINFNKFKYSNIYNKLILSEELDLYRKYKEESKTLHILSKHYGDINYNTYDNSFTGISKDKLLNYVKNPLILSYTSMNRYNLCAFSYYIKYILKLDPFEDSFAATLGSLYHKVLSLMKEEYFNFDKVWDEFLKDKELSKKEEYLLINLKKELKNIIEKIREQEKYTTFDKAFYEKELNVLFRKEILVQFIGTIDKLLYSNNIDDTYFSIIDYKTGSVDTTLTNMEYGINMQLPIYLYLVSKSNIFESPIFTGMYFQKILSSKPTFDSKKSIEDIKNENLKLVGYSTDNEEILEKFDNTYENSEMIKSLKKTKNGFAYYSKILNDEDVYNILKYTDKVINNSIDNILKGDFSIDPKITNGKDKISCMFCKYKDICFVKEKDYKHLESHKDLSFLEVE